MEILQNLRNEWEKGSTPLFHFGDAMEKLTVAKVKDSNTYNCLRYFTIGGTWSVSVDFRRIPLEAAFHWLQKHLGDMIPK